MLCRRLDTQTELREPSVGVVCWRVGGRRGRAIVLETWIYRDRVISECRGVVVGVGLLVCWTVLLYT